MVRHVLPRQEVRLPCLSADRGKPVGRRCGQTARHRYPRTPRPARSLRSLSALLASGAVLRGRGRPERDAPQCAGDHRGVAHRSGTVFERLWSETGCRLTIEHLLAERQFEFPVERAIFLTACTACLIPARTARRTSGERTTASRAPAPCSSTISTAPWHGSGRKSRCPDGSPAHGRENHGGQTDQGCDRGAVVRGTA